MFALSYGVRSVLSSETARVVLWLAYRMIGPSQVIIFLRS